MATTTRSIENSSRIISFDYKNKTAPRARGCFVFTCLPPSRQLCWTAAFFKRLFERSSCGCEGLPRCRGERQRPDCCSPWHGSDRQDGRSRRRAVKREYSHSSRRGQTRRLRHSVCMTRLCGTRRLPDDMPAALKNALRCRSKAPRAAHRIRENAAGRAARRIHRRADADRLRAGGTPQCYFLSSPARRPKKPGVPALPFSIVDARKVHVLSNTVLEV